MWIEGWECLLFVKDLGARFRAYLGSRSVFLAQAKHRFSRLEFIIFDKLVIISGLGSRKFDAK